MSSSERPKEFCLSARRTFKRVYAFELILWMCCANVIPLSYVSPRVVGVLVHGISLPFSVTGGCSVCSLFHGLISVNVDFFVETFSLHVWNHISRMTYIDVGCFHKPLYSQRMIHFNAQAT